MDLLKCVGGKYWSREAFLAEGRLLGVSLRVGMLPANVEIGQTRIFLAGDLSEEEWLNYRKERKERRKARRQAKAKGQTVSFKGKTMPRGTLSAFAYFTVKSVAYITGPGVNLPEELAKRGVTAYEYHEGGFGFCDERGCGSLEIGGTYFLSEEDLAKCKDLAESKTMEGNIIAISPPLPIPDKKFRGYKHIDGEALLRGLQNEAQ